MGFTHMEIEDLRTTEHKRFLIKTICSIPVKLRCLRVSVIAKALVYLPLTHTHKYTQHGLTPTQRVTSITTLLKPAATAEACTALKPTIGLRNSWFSFFSFWFSRSPPLPLSSDRQSPHPTLTCSMPLRSQAVKWVTAELKVLFLNWQRNILLGQRQNLFLIPILHTTFLSLCPPSSFSEASAHGASLPISAGPAASAERSVWGEHEQLQKFLVKWMKVTVTAHSALGMPAPPVPHSGQLKSKSLLSSN